MSTAPTEEITEGQFHEIDPEREGIKPSIRSCLSCKHANKCKFFATAVKHENEMKELIKISSFELDVLPAESLGSRCGEYESNVTVPDV